MSNLTASLSLLACTSPCERCFYTQVTCSRCLACTGEPEDCYLSGEGMTGLTHCDQTCPDTLEVEPERLNECGEPTVIMRTHISKEIQLLFSSLHHVCHQTARVGTIGN